MYVICNCTVMAAMFLKITSLAFKANWLEFFEQGGGVDLVNQNSNIVSLISEE